MRAIGLFLLALLKFAGWTVLILLLVLLTVLLLVLFVPVRYEVVAKNTRSIVPQQNDLTANLRLQLKVNWLLHLVHVTVCYGADGLSNRIRIFGLDLSKILAKRKSSARKRSARKSSVKKPSGDLGKNPETVTAKQKPVKHQPADDPSGQTKSGEELISESESEDLNYADLISENENLNHAHLKEEDAKQKNVKVQNAEIEKTKGTSTKAGDTEIENTKVTSAKAGNLEIENTKATSTKAGNTEIEKTKETSTKAGNTEIETVNTRNTTGKNSKGNRNEGSNENSEKRGPKKTGYKKPDHKKKNYKRSSKRKTKNSITPDRNTENADKTKHWKSGSHTRKKTETKEKHADASGQGIFSKIRFWYQRVRKEITDEVNQHALSHFWRELLKLLKSYKPRKLKADVSFSLADPALTGTVTGVFSMMPLLYRYPCRIVPDFTSEKLYVEGEILARGRVTVLVFLLSVLRLLRDKEFMHVVRRLMKREHA